MYESGLKLYDLQILQQKEQHLYLIRNSAKRDFNTIHKLNLVCCQKRFPKNKIVSIATKLILNSIEKDLFFLF